MNESTPRARYTLEFKLEAVRLVKSGQVAAATAKILGIAKQTLENWVRLAHKGQLKGAGDEPGINGGQTPIFTATEAAKPPVGSSGMCSKSTASTVP